MNRRANTIRKNGGRAGSRRRGAGEITRLIRAYLKSGKSQKRFALERGLALSTFQWWLRRHREARDGESENEYRSGRRGGDGLIEVKLTKGAPGPAPGSIEVELPSGVRLKVAPPVGTGDLAAVLQALKAH